MVAAAARDTVEGAVVAALGGATEFTVVAADAIRIIHWGAAQSWQRRTYSGFYMCCSAVVTAAAQGTAEGAVVTAAGGAAEGFHKWGCRCSQVDRGDGFSAIFSSGAAACGGGSSSTGCCGGAVVMAAGGDSQ